MTEVRKRFEKKSDVWWLHKEPAAGACGITVDELFEIPKRTKHATLVLSLEGDVDAYFLRFAVGAFYIALYHDDRWVPYPISIGLYRLLENASKELAYIRCRMYISVEYGGCA